MGLLSAAVFVRADAAQGCGDGELDEAGGEACDDGNTLPGDGCSEYCELESGRLSYCPDRVEFAYWITTYKRPGRWVHDITPMLAHFEQGGKRRMRFQVGTNGKQYLLTIKMRLSRTTLSSVARMRSFRCGQGAGMAPATMRLKSSKR